jgi:2,4-dienoyl-CoA reductase-like NADH-dependent reductase (Old Yellow Enzyme family)
MVEVDLQPLFAPFRLRHLTLRNRFVMPGMQRGQAVDGVPRDAMISYLRERAEGGCALITGEGTGLDHPTSFWQPIFCRLAQDTAVVWERSIEAVKGAGAHILLQLWHPGAMRRGLAPGSPTARYESLSPSGLVKSGYENGKAMDVRDLDDIKGAYVRAAELAKKLGADGVEIHAAHGYLLDEFLWAETNLREDAYGGLTLAQRARYPAEVVAAIRKAVGDDFVISFRFSQFKEIDLKARITDDPDELRDFLAVIRKAGADCFHVSTRRFDRPEWPDREQWGLARWVKSMTDAAVTAVGSVGLTVDTFSDLNDNQTPKLQVEADLEKVVQCMRRGDFDLIAVGRTHIANPNFVEKVRQRDFKNLINFNKAVHLKEFFDNFDHKAVTTSDHRASKESTDVS